MNFIFNVQNVYRIVSSVTGAPRQLKFLVCPHYTVSGTWGSFSSAGEHSNDGSLMLHSPISWPLSDDSGAYKKAAPYMTASLGQTLIDFIETKTFRTIFYHTKFKCFFSLIYDFIFSIDKFTITCLSILTISKSCMLQFNSLIDDIVPTQQDIHKMQNGPLSCPQ